MSEHNQPDNEVRAAYIEQREQAVPPQPRIYIASLSDYNAGRLHGRWINAARPADELREDIAAMLARSPEPIAEEWAIHDYTDFCGTSVDEHEDLETVSELARGIAQHGHAFAAWALLVDNEREGLARFEEAFLGTWDKVEDYAEELLDGIGATAELAQLPEWLHPYVKLDIEGFTRDLVLGGDILAIDDNGRAHIFDGRI